MIDYDLKKVRAVVFDVDGVLSAETITLSSEGEPLRTVNIKDGYAIQLAVRQGLHIAIITGGNTNAVRLRYSGLGVRDIYMKASDKMVAYVDLVERYGLKDEEVIYVGDDIPDYQLCLLSEGCMHRHKEHKPLCERPLWRLWRRTRHHRTGVES